MAKYAAVLPRGQEKFDSWQSNFVSGVSTRVSQWKLPQDKVDELLASSRIWRDNYRDALDGDRRPSQVKAKNEAQKALEKRLRDFIRFYLCDNPAVTDEDCASLGLHQVLPRRNKDTEVLLIAKVEVSVPEARVLKIRRRGLPPPNAHAVEMRWGFQETAPADPEALTGIEILDRKITHKAFAEGDSGRKLWFAVRWIGRSGVRHEWSDIQSTYIW
jgi:hypothetical protein